MTGTNSKLRAVFLSALMVLSVFGGTVALAGTATAQQTGANSGYWSSVDFDANVSSGSTYWQGQTLYFEDTSVGSSGGAATYQVWTITETSVGDYTTDSLVTEFSTNASGVGTIDTNDLPTAEDVVITDNSANVLNLTGHGQTDGTTATSVGAQAWQVVEQSFGADIDKDSVQNAGTNMETDVTFTSNRALFDVIVMWEGSAEPSELVGAFPNKWSAAAIPLEQGGEDEAIYLSGVSKATPTTLDFEDVPADTYNFTFVVSDTSVTAEDSLTVTEGGSGTASFTGNAIYSVQRGDYAIIPVTLTNTATATVQIGGPSVFYSFNATVEDGNGDGQVVLLFNTYNSGNLSQAGTLATADSEDSASFVGNAPAEQFSNAETVMGAGDYPLSLQVNNGETAVGTLIVEPSSITGSSTAIAPGAAQLNADTEIPTLTSAMTSSGSVARGDYAVAQFSASGLQGYFSPATLNGSAEAEGLKLELKQVRANPNAPESSMLVNTSNAQFVTDFANETFYVLWQVPANQATGQWNMTFSIEGSNNGVTENVNPNTVDASTTATFTVQEQSLELNDGETWIVPQGNRTIAGETNLAPGTELTVRARATGNNPFLKPVTVTVDEGGSFSGTLNFADAANGTEFSVQASGSTLKSSVSSSAAITGIVDQGWAPPTTSTPTTSTPTTSTPTTSTPTTSTPTTSTPTTSTPTDDDDEPTETTSDGQPGFGVAVALVAMLGAALLALRRRDN